MFILDDLLLRALGISVPGLDFVSTLELLENLAYKELYNPENIKNQIKENQMLYEFGEISKYEFENTKSRLMEQLKFIERFEEMNLSVRADILT
jgi:hypothetical protein